MATVPQGLSSALTTPTSFRGSAAYCLVPWWKEHPREHIRRDRQCATGAERRIQPTDDGHHSMSFLHRSAYQRHRCQDKSLRPSARPPSTATRHHPTPGRPARVQHEAEAACDQIEYNRPSKKMNSRSDQRSLLRQSQLGRPLKSRT